MIGIDTNILLRLWLNDAPSQNSRIDALLDAHGGTPESMLLTDVVLAEAVWTLRSAYGQNKAAQLTALRSVLGEIAFAFEDRNTVARAVTLFEDSACGFSDCLVAAKHAQHGCAFTATFDRAMRKLPNVRIL